MLGADIEWSDSEPDMPLWSRKRVKAMAIDVKKSGKKRKRATNTSGGSKRGKLNDGNKKTKKASKKKKVVSSDSDSSDSSESEEEQKPKKKKATKKKATKKKATKKKATKKKKTTKKKKGGKKEEKPKKPKKELPPQREWWKEPPLEEGKKWRSMKHNGVAFADPWTPHGVPLLYNGQRIELTPDQELYATHFAQVIDNPNYGANPVFRSNFFKDWRRMYLSKNGLDEVVTNLESCDFSLIVEWVAQEKARKKAMTKAEKEVIKARKEKIKEHYGYVFIDGFKEEVGNFTVEPPGLFRGRGEHPKRGCIKPPTMPEDITLNLSPDAPVPPCPMEGHTWKEIVHKDDTLWIASWREQVNGNFKYVWPAASSSLKQRSDLEKFDKARRLQYFIERIREDYMQRLSSDVLMDRQLGVAIWVIDKLALRVGNEKNAAEEADTFGCCSLQVGHVTVLDDLQIKLEFLGKDSMPYSNTVVVDELVYENVKSFMLNKGESDDLFDQISPNEVNKYLKTLMPGLSAKVFRTFNASYTLECELAKTPPGCSESDLKLFYNNANREVAILCNHQRSVNEESFNEQLEKIQERLKKAKKSLKERKAKLKEAKKDHDDAKKAKKKAATIKSLKKKVDKAKKLQENDAKRVKKIINDIQMKKDNKTVALGTSKINYMDPRITHAWCKKHGIPVKKIFNTALIRKFPWADVDPDWTFIEDTPEARQKAIQFCQKAAAKKSKSSKSKKKSTKKKSTKKKTSRKKATRKKKTTKKKTTKKKRSTRKKAKKKAPVDMDISDDGSLHGNTSDSSFAI